MHILYVLTRATNGRLYADLFREMASYFGNPDASLTMDGKSYFVHFIHKRLGELDEQTRREAVYLVTEQLKVTSGLNP
jgi:hypothetical protein